MSKGSRFFAIMYGIENDFNFKKNKPKKKKLPLKHHSSSREHVYGLNNKNPA